MAAENVRRELAAIYKSSQSWEWDLIRSNLNNPRSFAAQRHLITKKKRDINDILEKWPLLSELSGILSHFHELTKSELSSSFESFITNELDTLIEFMTLQSQQRVLNVKVQRELGDHCDISAKVMSSLVMLSLVLLFFRKN